MAGAHRIMTQLGFAAILMAAGCERRAAPQAQLTPAPPLKQATTADLDFFPIRLNGKQGFMERGGSVVIQPRFDKVYPFTEGLAAAQVGDLWGYIDSKGEWVVRPAFAMAGLFHDGRAHVRTSFNAPYGFIDPSGLLVIAPQFDCAEDFRGGVARVGVQTTVSKVTSRFADDGINCSWRYIDVSGAEVPSPPPAPAPAASTSALAPVKVGQKMGYANKQGSIVIAPQFDYAAPFERGLASFTLEGGKLCGYVDEKGRIVWPASE